MPFDLNHPEARNGFVITIAAVMGHESQEAGTHFDQCSLQVGTVQISRCHCQMLAMVKLWGRK